MKCSEPCDDHRSDQKQPYGESTSHTLAAGESWCSWSSICSPHTSNFGFSGSLKATQNLGQTNSLYGVKYCTAYAIHVSPKRSHLGRS